MELTAAQDATLKQLQASAKQVELLQQLANQEPMDLSTAERLLKEIKLELGVLGDKKPPAVNVNVDPVSLADTVRKALEDSSMALTEAISQIKLSPQVEAPKITVKPADVNIDLQSVVDAVKAAKPKIPAFPDSIKSDNSAIYIDGQDLQPLHVAVNFIDRGVIDLVEGMKGKSIRVVSGLLMANGHTDISFKSGFDDLSGPLPLRPNGGFSLPKNEYGWLQTSPGEGLSIQSSAYTTVGGMLTCVRL